jgi:GntR family transcriptional regulator/MocR family aminotransferase
VQRTPKLAGQSGPQSKAAKGLVIHIDPRLCDTLQKQVYDGVRQAILQGVLTPGSRLVSSRTLSRELGISRTTAVLALEQLIAEGYLTTSRGSGTFVTRELPDDLPRNHLFRRDNTRHPPLSRRGQALAAIPPAAIRVGGPPRAFRLGVPALDLFPVNIWAQIVNQRLRSITLSQLDYGDPRGFPDLRQAIADHVQTSRGTQCSPDQIFIVAGAQRGLELIFRLLLDPGDSAWMEDPGYTAARSALVEAGARILPLRVDEHGADVRMIVRHRGSVRLAYVTPSHQFPLGIPMTLPRRLALLQWARDAGAWIVEDDYDSEFRYDTRAIPCLHGLDTDGRVIYVGSFSKTLFPALRLGWLIAPPDLLESLRAARRAADLHPPILDQAVLANFIAEGHYDRHLRRMRAAYRERLEAMSESANRYCGGALRLRSVHTGLHALADLTEVDAEPVFHEAAARGIEVMPLDTYFMGTAKTKNSLLLGFASMRPEALRRGMQALADAIAAARKRRGYGT